jgi:hypothetical protein
MMLAGEALLLLLLARAMVLALPLRRIGPIMARRRARPDASREVVAAINWALDAAGARLPVRTACYERGIAACWMLARRGYGALMHYGVGQVDSKIAAHVWVTSGPLDVVGVEIAPKFKELARF